MEEAIFENVSIDEIDEPEDELRSEISQEKFDELVASIKTIGIIQPLALAQNEARYQIICGHRRFMAAKAIGLFLVTKSL